MTDAVDLSTPRFRQSLVTEVDGHRITRLDLRATPTAAPPEPV